MAYEITADNNSQTVEDIFLAEGDWGVMVAVTELNDASDITGYYTMTDKTYTKATGTWTSGTTYYKLIDETTVTGSTGGDGKYYPIDWKVVKGGDAKEITDTKDLAKISTSMIAGIGAGTHLSLIHI